MTHDLTCEEVLEKLFDYLDRELDSVSQAEIDRHLETCRGCFSRAEFERRLRKRIADAAAVKAPASLNKRVKDIMDRF